MRLPRGLQTGAVPTGPVAFDSGGAAKLADQVSSFTDQVIEEQARAEFTDALSAAESTTRDYLDNAKQIRTNEDTGRPAFETAEQDFDKFYDELRSKSVEGLSTNRAKERVTEQLSVMRDRAKASVRSIARGQRIDDIVTRTNSAVDRYVGLGEYDSARLALNDQKAFYSSERFDRVSQLIDSAESGAIHDQKVNGVMSEHAVAMQAGNSAQFIRNFRATSTFDEEETRKIAGKMLTQNNQFEAEQDELDEEFKAQEARALQARIFSIDERADIGDVSVIPEIKSMVSAGDISATQGSAMRRRAETAAETNRQAVDGYAILSAGGILDPKNKAHRQLVDKELQAIIAETGSIETPETRTGIARLIKQTNIIPDGVKQTAISARIAGSVEQVVALADVVARVSESAPMQYGQFSEDDRAFYGMANMLVRGGMDPTLAVDATRDRLTKSEEDSKVSDARYRQAIQGDSNLEAATDWATDEFDSFLSFAPDDRSVPDALIADYEALTRTFFEKTRDIDIARDLAQQKLKGVWGRSDVNGDPQVMRYPPDMIHGDWVRDQVTADMNAVGVSPDTWELVSDPITARTGGQSYGLMRRTEVGLEPILVPDDNGRLQIARYQPDYASSDAAQKQKERERKFVSLANKERDRLLAQDALREKNRFDPLLNEFGSD